MCAYTKDLIGLLEARTHNGAFAFKICAQLETKLVATLMHRFGLSRFDAELLLWYFVVFNVAQIDGLPDNIAKLPTTKPRHFDVRNPLIEEFVATTKATIFENTGYPFYHNEFDHIQIPPFIMFNSAAAYYAVLFHELIHWTGAKHRLARNLASRFRTKEKKAAEELIAELGSAFLAAEFDLDRNFTVSTASYIASWIQLLKDDPKAIFICANRAQAAVDYLRELALREPAQAAE